MSSVTTDKRQAVVSQHKRPRSVSRGLALFVAMTLILLIGMVAMGWQPIMQAHASTSVEVVDLNEDKGSTDGDENELVFESDEFSIYIVALTKLHKKLTASDGKTYTVTVDVPSGAGIPKDAELQVTEILEDSGEWSDYVDQLSELLGGQPEHVRLFDITIMSGDTEIQPSEPVSVKIELDDAYKLDEDVQAVHFGEEGMEVLDASLEGDTVSFEAESFSAYAIVEGPSTNPENWNKVTSLDELFDKASLGLYVGHVDGYYFMNTLKADSKRTGIEKTKPAQTVPPTDKAALYYFERVEGTENQVYAYCYDASGNKKYVSNIVKNQQNNLTLTDAANKVAFTVSVSGDGVFTFKNGAYYWNMQGGASGARFCSYNTDGDPNNNMYLWYTDSLDGDPYGLDGTSHGLLSWSGGTVGKALMAKPSGTNALEAMPLTVMSNTSNNDDKLFVPNDSEITIWDFKWIESDKYYITATVDGSLRYLHVSDGGVTLVSDRSEASRIQVVPGTGTHAGEIHLKSGDVVLTYNGSETGFCIGGGVGSEWLHFAVESELTSRYFMTHSASKVSVSDQDLTTGSKVIVYTRTWNADKECYEFYAINHDGSLLRCYESGDKIEWVGSRINTLLWQFTEYKEENGTPNFYYELYNQYSEKFLAPQITGNQILSRDTLGINLDGRRTGQYYSSILAWDEDNYAYAGLKAEDGRIVACPKSEAMDFYFAVMDDVEVDDVLHPVPTVDNDQHGIKMKIVDFDTRAEMSNFLGNNEGGAVLVTKPGLLSTNLGPDGYPTAVGGSLGTLFAGVQEVNHLFIESIYQGSGYFEFNSTENFATLQGATSGDFTVYQELGTYDSSGGNIVTRNTLMHGQFFPFNDLQPGLFASVNAKNLYAATGEELGSDNPRKYEQLYLIEDKEDPVNTYYGMELEASFIQTPNGLDAWNHDIIYEFTGDDDFWLYVDGELVIDLGGIHSALAGSVNFRTGKVLVNGTQTTLRALFEKNFKTRYKAEHNNAAPPQADVDAFLAEYFEGDSTIFKPNSSHTMRIFYMERGAGAANLHMRFNLASIKPGTVLLNKELDGVDQAETVYAQFPYQIIYKMEGSDEEHYLRNATADASKGTDDYVFYKDTVNTVTYRPTFTVDGCTYQDVFLLKPGETAEINFPEGVSEYRIVECGVDTDVYNKVSANGQEITGTNADGSDHRKDYGIDYKTTAERARVTYANTVDPDALRMLTITKRLFKEDGTTEIDYATDQTEFSLRLYLGTEFDDAPKLANMHTYHVKDPNGNYCTWDTASKTFQSTDKNDYTSLTDEEKADTTFHTSMNGAIARIPAGFTVEIRQVLAGTQYRVQERTNEIPDGYSFQKYQLNGVDYKVEGSNTLVDAMTGVNDAIVAREDPHVDVCNLRGWGLRVNKTWSDADYMSQRDATYFAVFTDDGTGALTLVDDTVRQMTFQASPQSLYWYFLPLPRPEVPFIHYEIREVTIDNANPTINDEGIVTDPGIVTPIDNDGTLTKNGTQKGETESSQFDYTVLYQKGDVEDTSNVRVDEVTNSRPGIVLKKQDWDGNALAGATFTLKCGDDLIGRFTSNEQGEITVAFLRDDVDYTLTEIQTPQGYHGLEAAMTLRLSNGTVTVSGVDPEYYDIEQAVGTTPTLTIKNRPFGFQAVKTDATTKEPLTGVTFALHKQVTVDGVTTIDLNPMPGYENLVSGGHGIIPGINGTLPAGTYELREKSTLDGYQMLSTYVKFTISAVGEVSLGTHPEGVMLSETTDDNGKISYVLFIANMRRRQVSVWKTDVDHNTIATGASFDLYKAEDYDDEAGQPVEGASAIMSGTTGENGILALGELEIGNYRLVETEAPDGYNVSNAAIQISVGADRVTAIQAGNPAEVMQEGGQHWVSGQPDDTWQIRVWNSSGTELPSTGASGVNAGAILGLVLLVAGICWLYHKVYMAQLEV